MEIWTLATNRKTQVVSWSKKIFTTGRRKQVKDFFEFKSASLSQLVMEELQKDGKRRWIVFSDREDEWVTTLSKVFQTSVNPSPAILFLHSVLIPVRESYRKPFCVTYIREDDPNKSIFESRAKLRLALQIDGEQ